MLSEYVNKLCLSVRHDPEWITSPNGLMFWHRATALCYKGAMLSTPWPHSLSSPPSFLVSTSLSSPSFLFSLCFSNHLVQEFILSLPLIHALLPTLSPPPQPVVPLPSPPPPTTTLSLLLLSKSFPIQWSGFWIVRSHFLCSPGMLQPSSLRGGVERGCFTVSDGRGRRAKRPRDGVFSIPQRALKLQMLVHCVRFPLRVWVCLCIRLTTIQSSRGTMYFLGRLYKVHENWLPHTHVWSTNTSLKRLIWSVS